MIAPAYFLPLSSWTHLVAATSLTDRTQRRIGITAELPCHNSIWIAAWLSDHTVREALDSWEDCRGRHGETMAEWLPVFINKIVYDAMQKKLGTSRVCHDPTVMTADSLCRSAVHPFHGGWSRNAGGFARRAGGQWASI
jgi:hypothetical protein